MGGRRRGETDDNFGNLSDESTDRVPLLQLHIYGADRAYRSPHAEQARE